MKEPLTVKMLNRVRYTEVAGTGSYTARVRHNRSEESVYVYTIYRSTIILTSHSHSVILDPPMR